MTVRVPARERLLVLLLVASAFALLVAQPAQAGERSTTRHAKALPGRAAAERGAAERPGSRQASEDDVAGATAVDLDTQWYRDNSDLTTEPAEPITADDQSACPGTDGNDYQIEGTLWFRITGNGGAVLLTTNGSTINTILAVYPGNAAPSVDNNIECSVGLDFDPAAIELNTTAGAEYLVQVGGRAGEGPGVLGFSVLGADLRANPHAIAIGSDTLTNVGATTEFGEPVRCGAAGYGQTIWLRFRTTAQGTVTFVVSSNDFAPATAIYRADSLTPLACDAGNTQGALAATLSTELPAGDYLVQVGAVDEGGPGTLTYTLRFAEDQDVDRDGVKNRPYGNDCDDNDPSRSPDRPDTGVNGKDDNCNGVVDDDRDADTFADRQRVPGGTDCDDGNPTIKPGANEIVGNGVDENCDGHDDPFQVIQSSVRLQSVPLGRFTRLVGLTVENVPAGATVRLKCSRRCPVRSFSKRVRTAGNVNLNSRVRGKRLRTGTVLEVRVTVAGRIGKVTRWRMRRGAAPRRTNLCVNPGSTRTTSCPA